MSTRICLGANTHQLLRAGGHIWFYLNWALGLKAVGCEVVWLEQVDLSMPAEQISDAIASLKRLLAPYGLADSVALCSPNGKALPHEVIKGCLDAEVATDADYEHHGREARAFVEEHFNATKVVSRILEQALA